MDKVLSIFIIYIFSFANVSAQYLPGEIKSSKPKPRNEKNGPAGSAFAGLSVKGVNTFDIWGLDAGMTGGFIISDHFGIGASFYTLLTQNVSIKQPQNYFLSLIYGGVEPQFLFQIKPFIFHTKILVGYGLAELSSNPGFQVFNREPGTWIFISEPSLGISYIINEDFWLTFDAGYRVSGGINSNNINIENINGAVLSLSLKTIMY